MGIIKAVTGSAGGSAADSWKEFYYCEAMSQEVLGVRAEKRLSERSTDTESNPNVITTGSLLVVADGECALFTDFGKVKGVYDTPGEHEIKEGTAGAFSGKGLSAVFEDIGRRISFGGDVPADQRIYYINTKEILDNKFSTERPIPVHIYDENTGLDTDAGVNISGTYSFRIADCRKFYEKVCGNFRKVFCKIQIEDQLNAEFLSALNEAAGKVLSGGMRPSELPLNTGKLCEYINKSTADKFFSLRGIEIVSIAISGLSLTDKDGRTVRELQKTAVYRDPLAAAAALTDAAAESLKAAASNRAGFVGTGYIVKHSEDGWLCSCGTFNRGKFCTNCGKGRSYE